MCAGERKDNINQDIIRSASATTSLNFRARRQLWRRLAVLGKLVRPREYKDRLIYYSPLLHSNIQTASKCLNDSGRP
jgi:hypothetical protein